MWKTEAKTCARSPQWKLSRYCQVSFSLQNTGADPRMVRIGYFGAIFGLYQPPGPPPFGSCPPLFTYPGSTPGTVLVKCLFRKHCLIGYLAKTAERDQNWATTSKIHTPPGLHTTKNISPSPLLQIGSVCYIDVDQGSLINRKIEK